MYDFNVAQSMRNIRTKFELVHNHSTTGNAGDIIPFFRKEILPGDEITLYGKTLIKMTTPSTHVMDNAQCSIYYFYVPRRLLWKHWKNFMGEKSVGPHEVEPNFTIPQTTAPSGGWGENTIADYLKIPTKIENIKVDSAYFRAYCLIWNEWFRDQNRQDFTDFSDGDENTSGSNGTNYVTDAIGGGRCLKACKLSDYFTRTLLQPQQGDPVMLPLGDKAPVKNDLTEFSNKFSPAWLNSNNTYLNTYNRINAYGGQSNKGPEDNGYGEPIYLNLKADLSRATSATVRQVRMAFSLQKIQESLARNGSRYNEILKNRWGVTPSDASLQRPEFLGGNEIQIAIHPVVQTSSTNETSPLGQISGYSNTVDETHQYFHRYFEEHGIILGLAVVRHQRTYQQGLSKIFTRKTPEDFFNAELQTIGETNVFNYEIFATGDEKKDNETFGYQEYGAEYKFEPNAVTGQFRSNATNSFDNYHYADDYSETPVNGEDWIVEGTEEIDRTLTMTSEKMNQFMFDFGIKEVNIRTMAPHSIPGMLDHH